MDKSGQSNGAICAQYIFLGAFVKSAVRSCLNTAQMSLILNAFGVVDDILNIYVANFIQWLVGDGVDPADPPHPDPAHPVPAHLDTAKGERVKELEQVSIPIEKVQNIDVNILDTQLLDNQKVVQGDSSSSRRPEQNIPSEPAPQQISARTPIVVNNISKTLEVKVEEVLGDIKDTEKGKIKSDNEERIINPDTKNRISIPDKDRTSIPDNENRISVPDKDRIPDNEEKITIPYESRDVMFTSLIVEGIALTERVLQHLQIMVTIQGKYVYLYVLSVYVYI